MWYDNETDQDFLNFTGVAEVAAEIILQSQGKPISIGISGGWGVGKTSMVKLIRTAVEQKRDNNEPAYLFVEFNAWLYQGYDDARAALIDVVSTALNEEAEKNKRPTTKIKELLKRVDWFRAFKLTAGTGVALATGLAPVGLIAASLSLARLVATGKGDQKSAEGIDASVAKLADEAHGLLKAKAETSPPKEIHAIRELFEETLAEMNIRLVVLVDDLDRCLPETTIATLEAIRLLLFLKNAAFVIAADDQMIRNAVKKHFDGVDDEMTLSYFDKLIQVPIRVPPLGIQEVKAYIMLLYVENSSLEPQHKIDIRQKVCEQLKKSWQGEQVSRAFISGLGVTLPTPLVSQLDIAERLAPLLTTATRIAGNPRLIKRFLNTLSIRLAVARAHGVTVDESMLAKMLLFERCGDALAYSALTKAIIEDEGKPSFLGKYEDALRAGKADAIEKPWDTDFLREWLSLPPQLAGQDLRGALYVSRTHAPVIVPGDKLSSDAVDVLTALLQHPESASTLRERIAGLQRFETATIMARLLEQAQREQAWGVPDILEPCLVVSEIDPSATTSLVAFLSERPVAQLKPAIVPRIKDRPWAAEVFAVWLKNRVGGPMKRAIESVQNGNV